MNITKLNSKFILIIFILITYTSPAHAYLDPGTGSMLIQGLIGGLAVAMSFISIYWHKFKSFFSKSDLKVGTKKDKENKN
tara:strand:- start:97 stop:336 length:240 start_codon:yes stop_codon:yes gene_type:complete